MKNARSSGFLTGRAALVVYLLTATVVLSISFSACIWIRSSTIGETTGSGTPVGASASDYGILGLTQPQGLTSTVSAELARQCASGLLTDVQTQLSMRDWFLIVQYYTIAANAVCLPPPPPPAPPPAAPSGPKIILRGVHFDFDRYNIRPEDASVLDEAAEVLKQNPNVTVDVNGYTDSTGSAAYNQRLSEKRAGSVVDYLKDKGIAGDRLIPHGYGATNFVASNSTREGRAENRRVELVPVH
jgi:outer membrane protein OmpA-like peptidoglycan-associated protein